MTNSHDPDDETGAIARLDPAIQRPLYEMGWTRLRPLQVAAIRAINEGDGDLILSAQTASGKTEAAFLPILSAIVGLGDEPGVKAVYAGPLKALINDQFLRLERLCEAATIPVHRWHGDVGASAKKGLLESPSGVLLITPESIESLLVNHGDRLDRVFGSLRFVVIDEMHAFLADERGAQLRSVLGRLKRRSRHPVRTVGLSATLGDPEAARRWLRPAEPGRVTLVVDGGAGKEVRVRVNGYVEIEEEDASGKPSAHEAMMRDVFEAFRGRTALIFGDSKRRLEECAEFAGRESTARGLANPFRVHHGSLSKAEREETEEALRSGRPVAAFCTSTLEMGIDVGDVEAVGQVGTPPTVAALVQRVGRSGRRDDAPRVLRMFLAEDRPDPDAPAVDRLYPEFLRGVASAGLMLEGWCEPADVSRLHLSTLVQQALSLIAETGGIRADAMFERLVAQGPFTDVDQPMFAALLRSIAGADLIEQDPEGVLILGIEGEKVVRSFDFYAAFTSTEQLRVVHDGREVGSVAYSPGLLDGGGLLLAGRGWRVTEVDRRRGTISVVPGGSGDATQAGSRPSRGGSEVHPHVASAIRDLLRSEAILPYLDPTAATMLAESRALAREIGALDGGPIGDGPRVLWFTWAGSRVDRTLLAIATTALGLKARDGGIALVFEHATEAAVRASYRSILEAPPSAEALAAGLPGRALEKYDPYLSDDLLARAFARDHLDLDGALTLIRDLE